MRPSGCFVLMPLLLALGACSSADSEPAVPASSTTAAPATTSSPATTIPASSTTQPTSPVATVTETGPPASASPLTVPLAMLRVDDTGAATVEVLLCNTGEAEARAVSASVVGGAGTVPLGLPRDVPPLSCRAVLDPSQPLESFGIPGDGTHSLTVRVDDGAVVTDHAVDLPVRLATLPAPPDQVAAYQECRRQHDHAGCVGRIPYFPVPGSGEVMVVHGDLRAVGPGEWEDIATYQVADDTICVPLLEGFLGVTGPRPVGWRNVVLAEPAGSGLSALPGVVMYLRTTVEEFARFRADLDVYGWRRTFLAGECGNEHEGTHLILGEVPLPTVLNEGLATLAAALDGAGALGQRQISCSDGGWRYAGETGDRPFEDLDSAGFTLEMIDSSVCFWEYLLDRFGPEGFRAVTSGLHALQDPGFNGCSEMRRATPFLTAVVTPVLGEDLSSVTEARWGFGSGFTGCEHV